MYLYGRLVLLVEREFVIIKVDTADEVQIRTETEIERVTYMIVREISREFIFLTVASQSSISMGLWPSVTMTILRVHVRFLLR